MDPDSPLPIIDGKYQLLRQLGAGGMGAVFEARHLGTGRRVAVKVISSELLSGNAEVVNRFRREAMASGAIESQHIAHVIDTGVEPSSGRPYMVMELLIGEDVEQVLKRIGPFPPDLALRVIGQACLGLQRAHEESVIHRDIKPANIFLARRDRDAGELVVKILDFGIAKMRGAEQLPSREARSLTQTGSLLGSPLYMSPEQALGRKTIDHRTDIWSLGVVLYEALTGQPPHAQSETVGELLVNVCHEPARHVQDLAPWVPPETAAIVHRALALDPAVRFPSAKEMFAAIQERLPRGHGLDLSMLVSVASEARSAGQARLTLVSAVGVPAPSSSQTLPRLSAADASGPLRVGTETGFEAGPGKTTISKRSARPIGVGIAALVVTGLAVGLYTARASFTSSGTPPTVPVSSLGTDVRIAPAPPPEAAVTALVPLGDAPPSGVTPDAHAPAATPVPSAAPPPHPAPFPPPTTRAPPAPAKPKATTNDIF